MLTEKQVQEELLRLVEKTTNDDDYHNFFYDFIRACGQGMGLKTELGHATAVEEGEFLESGDKIRFFIFKVGDQLFRTTGWYNSWSGEGEWNYDDTKEVVQQKVTRYEYLVKGSNNDANSNRV